MRQMRPHAPWIAVLFLLGLIAPPLDLLVPIPLKIVVDCIAGKEPLPAGLALVVPASLQSSPTRILLLAAGLMIGVALLRQLLELASGLLRTYTGERMVLDFRARLFSRV
jgi:ATP-binding cassette subfamily B protein